MKIARLTLITATFCLTLAGAHAAPIDSVESAMAKPQLQKLDSFLAEQQVARQLTAIGLTPDEARARLARLDDTQLTALAAQADTLRAGGDIVQGHPYPLGPIGCVLKRIGDTIAHVIKVLFCWTDIP